MDLPCLETQVLDFDTQVSDMTFDPALIVNEHTEVLVFLSNRDSKLL